MMRESIPDVQGLATVQRSNHAPRHANGPESGPRDSIIILDFNRFVQAFTIVRGISDADLMPPPSLPHRLNKQHQRR